MKTTIERHDQTMKFGTENELVRYIESQIRFVTKKYHFQRIETDINPGVHDVNYCIDGIEGWMELKIARPNWTGRLSPIIRPSQISWGYKRQRSGGSPLLVIGTLLPQDRQGILFVRRMVNWDWVESGNLYLRSSGEPRNLPGNKICFVKIDSCFAEQYIYKGLINKTYK